MCRDSYQLDSKRMKIVPLNLDGTLICQWDIRIWISHKRYIPSL